MFCREVLYLKLETVRVRRSRPTVPAAALALMLTMLFVYIISLSGRPAAQQTGAQIPAGAEVVLPALTAHFHCAGRYTSRLDAQLAAAKCAQAGGAGLILPDGEGYAVVDRAGDDSGESTLSLQSGALTLHLNGQSDDVRAISDAVLFLQTLHGETGALADSLERGDTNASGIASLMQVYRTRGKRALDGLIAIETGSVTVSCLTENVQDAILRLECAMEKPTTAHLRHLHAAACADWISLLENLTAIAEQQAPVV